MRAVSGATKCATIEDVQMRDPLRVEGEDMKRLGKLFGAVCVFAFAVVLSACAVESHKSFVFSVETGDDIEVRLDTSSGYDLRAEEGRFYISKEGEDVAMGIFYTGEMFDAMIKDAQAYGENYEEGELKGHESYYWEPGDEWDFMVWVKDSHTGVAVASTSEEVADDMMELLTFTLDTDE